MTQTTTSKTDCLDCDGVGLVSPAWDVLPPCGEAPTLIDCATCEGSGKVPAP